MSTIHIALTGHRPSKLGGYNLNTPAYQTLKHDLEQYILYQLQTHQIVWCHSGLALGADTIWSMAILNMKSRYPSRVKFHAEIPMMTQSNRWFKQSDINFWHTQIQKCDNSTLYSTQETMTTYQAAKALDDRNKGMVDHCDILLTIWNGSSGGTKNAKDYAESVGKKIQPIDPTNYFNN